ncbi:uncharacterized protein LOC121957188 isoform X1 [Plectropomus leopardus]|uniref:uncharacterized protein LOC121957188 isoform X1 n=1 Tax=Plectropomus leopardus TaxID=160734 RepID=UPI001C4B453E|nr:uncharacterized protein LOC121957188 isoform X1 [Plectropomus leopardus]
MCHDPTTADKFYVALPDKIMAYETRMLRLKALRMSESHMEHDEDETSLSDTGETSSEDEQPINDDGPDSESSLSSDELRRMPQKRAAKNLTVTVSGPSSSEDEVPPAQPLPYKKRLKFTGKSKKYGIPKRPDVFALSKCKVQVERLSSSITEYYKTKMKSQFLPKQVVHSDHPPPAECSVRNEVDITDQEKGGCQIEERPHMTSRSFPTPPVEQAPGDVQEPPTSIKQTPEETNPEGAQQSASMLSSLETPEYVYLPIEILESVPETLVMDIQDCAPDTLIQMTTEVIVETLAEDMPQTQAADPTGCAPENLTPMTAESLEAVKQIVDATTT